MQILGISTFKQSDTFSIACCFSYKNLNLLTSYFVCLYLKMIIDKQENNSTFKNYHFISKWYYFILKNSYWFKHNHCFQKDPAVLVAKSCKMGNVQISNASIIHLVMVMETAAVIRNFANVMSDLVEQTVQLILKVRNFNNMKP